ncbi:MAG: carboxypeptidase regulatory-like domain-containing protein [Bifidobacteriaceae bacterium]|jgi:hypothetical protein|nr:carboxypeptidase regulatory-like domain-containing protein [Bifidobacteriaceae bacterium]
MRKQTSRRYLTGLLAAVTVGSLTLTVLGAPAQADDPPPRTLGKVAGQPLSYCEANSLARNDDGFTGEVSLPFEINFYGAHLDKLWVNNNGNVTFNQGLSTYTPWNLTGEVGYAIIAPFFADVDTRGEASKLVTYGAAPDGSAFCVNWEDVGYYASRTDKLNTFQLILSKPPAAANRPDGDFDITFNYDQILWETGEASGGVGGFGGTSAAAGWTLGTGEPGTFTQLEGSFVNGALLDSGPQALINHAQGSSQLGRYVWEIRNSTFNPEVGNLTGRVIDEQGQPVSDAYVAATRSVFGSNTYTDAQGHFSLVGLRALDYNLRVDPPAGAELRPATVAAAVTAGQTNDIGNIILRAARTLPINTSMTNITGETADGAPIFYYHYPTTLTVTNQCVGGSGRYEMWINGRLVAADNLIEAPPGTYSQVIDPTYPIWGNGFINYWIDCPGNPQERPTTFDIYIDPSGVIVNQYGDPISGATVTLSRSETAEGTYTVLPNGSPILSQNTPDNPQTTTSDGFFGWDVQAGWYQVNVTTPGGGQAQVGQMQVPPARTSLVISANVPGARPSQPTVAPQFAGTVAAGQTVSLVEGTWSGAVTTDVITWQSGGVNLGTGPSVSLPLDWSGDLEAVIQAHRTVQGHDQGISPEDGGSIVNYNFPFTYTLTANGIVWPEIPTQGTDYSPILQVYVSIYAGLYENTADYWTTASFAAFTSALANARTALASGFVSQADCERLSAALVAAGEGLRPAVDRSALASLVAIASEILADPDGYVSTGIAELTTALATARAVLDDPLATQDQIAAQTTALAQTLSRVFPKGDKTLLQALIGLVSSLDGEKYTPNSWQAVSAALSAAQLVQADVDASDQAVDAAVSGLEQALDQLKLRASKSGLASAIAVASTITSNAGLYVPSSLAGLADALSAAQAVYADNNASQAEVAAAQAALLARITVAKLRLTGANPLPLAVAAKAAADPAAVITLSLAKPTVKGKARVGRVLRASVKAPGAALQYQWYRSGKAIAGAKSATYRVSKADAGKRLSVRVKASVVGGKAVAKRSAKTSKVKR